MALLGWLGKTLWDAVQDLKQDVKEIEINLPKDYVGKNDYKEDVREIKDMLKQLFEHFHKER
jgi:cobalamin biosynthesis Co2+ chelatase CbiK